MFPNGEQLIWPDEDARGAHYQGDVRDLFDSHHPVNFERTQEWHRSCGVPGRDWFLWDLVIAFPPCDHLSLAGARYWKEKQADGRQAAGAAFFMEMVNAPAPYVAVENPVGIMGRRSDPLYRVPDQVVQPYMFGDPLTKATCLWLKGLPPLEAGNLVASQGRVATGGGSWRTDQRHGRGAGNWHEDGDGRKNRQRNRNRTLPGFARAMAGQWGPYVEAQENVG